ncbi:hypothetical protein ACFQJ7_09775 [Halovenus rubra]|uniref:Uncharacterized protein n=2 Tax=Halovenus rubra TaxID=869890 RepID=A0ACC7DXU4_9EURY|nr:hypothetical protein [Halovenus rubra]
MGGKNVPSMVLDETKLNEKDKIILDYLTTEGRATPAILEEVIAEQTEGGGVSRSYINQRLVRLAEHHHIKNIRGKGVYEFVSDPRAE